MKRAKSGRRSNKSVLGVDHWDSSRFLVLHGVDYRSWARRHEITPWSGERTCNECGLIRVVTTTVPFFQGQFRGLMSPPCECGRDEQTPWCIVRDSRYGDLFTGG